MSSKQQKLNGNDISIDSAQSTAHPSVAANNFESRLNHLNHLNSINLLNSQNLNNIQIKKEFEINGNFINSSSDSENSDEITNENNRNCVESSGNSRKH